MAGPLCDLQRSKDALVPGLSRISVVVRPALMGQPREIVAGREAVEMMPFSSSPGAGSQPEGRAQLALE
jgi:hypothetical protein